MRATTSGGEPGGYGAMMRIGLLGQAGVVAACATAWFPIAMTRMAQVLNNKREQCVLVFMLTSGCARVFPAEGTVNHGMPSRCKMVK